MRRLLYAILVLLPAPAMAEDAAPQVLPACVTTGAASVMFNGKPALKLADVAACPPASYEIIPNVIIEGQPMVHLTIDCAAGGSANVSAGGKAASTLGDAACPQL